MAQAETAADPRDVAAMQHALEQFYYLEAELLDDRRFHEWLDLLADDVVYVMPVRAMLQRRDSADEFGGDRGAAFFDENKPTLQMRVRKLLQPSAWAEDPPSRTRHMVTNVRIREATDSGLRVKSNFHVHQSRGERRVDSFIGERHDLLRRSSQGFTIVERRILLDETTLLAPLLSTFF